MIENVFEERRRDHFHRLRASLPDDADQTIEAHARRIINLVIEFEPTGSMPITPDPKTCPNCGAATDAKKTPYCSEDCRDIAGFVRQFRTGLTLGWIFEPDKQIALGQNLWDILGGGRPLRREIAPPKAREKALARENWICQSCGKPATTIDHIGSGCNRPINLRAVCDDCCTDRPFNDPRVLNDPGTQTTLANIKNRIQSGRPIRVCDDADTWDWREYLRMRIGQT